MWDPILDAAVANNELPPGLPRSDIHLWLGDVTKMVMRGLEDGEGDVRRYRSILRRFVVPAFCARGANRTAIAKSRHSELHTDTPKHHRLGRAIESTRSVSIRRSEYLVQMLWGPVEIGTGFGGRCGELRRLR